MSYIFAAVAIVITFYLWLKNKKILSCYYILACMWTEFYYINICGGKVRLYHFVALTILFLEIIKALDLLKQKRYWLVWGFVIWAVFVSVMSENILKAFISSISLVLNCTVGIATVIILIRHWITVDELQKTIVLGVNVSCIVGIVQFVLKMTCNINIGMSAEQITQIAIGMIPGLTTEANVFGRCLMVYMAFLLPRLIAKDNKIRGIWLMYVLAVFCTVINATRSVLYPAFFALFLGLLVSIKKKCLKDTVVTYLKLGTVFLCVVVLLFGGIIPAPAYTVYKLKSMLGGVTLGLDKMLDGGEYVAIANPDEEEYITIDDINAEKAEGELLAMNEQLAEHTEKNHVDPSSFQYKGYDESATHRIGMAKLAIESCISDIKTILVGKGWGQVYVLQGNILMQAGGGDWVSPFVYTGCIGLLLYIVMTGSTFLNLFLEGVLRNREDKLLSQQLVGALGACFILGICGLLTSNIIMFYYWQILFVSIYMINQAKEC